MALPDGWAMCQDFRALAVAFVAAVLALPVGGAAAADLVPAYQAASPEKPFSCYAGVLGEVVISHPEFHNTLAPGSYSESYALGNRGGVLAGCDYLFSAGTFVGAEMTAAYGQVKGNQVGLLFNMPWEAATRIRIGYRLDPDVSVFFAGGAAVASLETTDPAGVSNKQTMVGGQVATGFEYRFAPMWWFRGEYSYTNYGSQNITLTGVPSARMTPSEHSVRMAVFRTF